MSALPQISILVLQSKQVVNGRFTACPVCFKAMKKKQRNASVRKGTDCKVAIRDTFFSDRLESRAKHRNYGDGETDADGYENKTGKN